MLIAHEEKNWIALRKPAGLPVFPPHAEPSGDSLFFRFISKFPEQITEWPLGFEGGIVHRLDTATSGLVLAARTVAELLDLRSKFAEKQLVKQYFFLSARQVAWEKHRIDRPLAHDRKRKGRMVVQRGKNTPHRGKWYPASTDFEFMCKGQDGVSLWRATMRSGVMHQIRLHAAFAGIALLGDRHYGGGPTPTAFPAAFALHHSTISGIEGVPVLAPPVWWPRWALNHLKIGSEAQS